MSPRKPRTRKAADEAAPAFAERADIARLETVWADAPG